MFCLLLNNGAWTFFKNLKFPKFQDLSIQDELILSKTALRCAESKNAERQLIFHGLDFEIRPQWTPPGCLFTWWVFIPRDGIKLALLDFATQYSMLACGMCLEWAPRLFR